MDKNIYLHNIEDKYVDDLVDIFNNDVKLRSALYSKKKTTKDEFISIIQEWQIKTNSKTFAVILKDKAIGTISLSHIKEDRSAQVGYWIGSNYWNKGYTTQAFIEILDFAKKINIKSITCSIKKDNIASRLIWEKFDADFEEDDERVYPKINL